MTAVTSAALMVVIVKPIRASLPRNFMKTLNDSPPRIDNPKGVEAPGRIR